MILKSNFSPSGRAIYADDFFTNGLRQDDPLYGLTWNQVFQRGVMSHSLTPRVPEYQRESWRDYLWSGNPIAQLGATVYSDGMVLVRSGRKVPPNVMGGAVRCLYWNFATLAAGNIGDVLVCGKVYKGERVLNGDEQHSALTSGAGTAGGSYGDYAVLADGVSLGAVGTAARFLASTSFEAAGTTRIATTIALSAGFEATADFFLCCTNDTELFATAGRVCGDLLVVKN